MSKGLIIALVLIVALFGGMIALGSRGSDKQALTFATVSANIDKGAKLYDVRTAAEYSAGHIERSVNLSLQDIEAGKLPDVAKDTELYLYCESGSRAAQAAGLLKNAGYTNVTNLYGIANVKSMGGTIKKS